MRPRTWVALVAGCSALALSPAAAAAVQADTVTATGTGESLVHPKNRNNNASIASAYDNARQAAIGGALKEARTYALAYAKGVGLTLGPVQSVSDVQNNVFYGPGQFEGPFGPNQFCGIEHQAIFKKEKNGRRKVVGTKKVHRCIVPRFADVTLTVTYSAT
jgi:uncharacterized protein YggE